MTDKRSERRLVENEAIFRGENELVTEGIEKLDRLAKRQGQESLAFDRTQSLHFYCECSSVACEGRVEVIVNDYLRIHKNRKRFVVSEGHETPKVERVVERTPHYLIVEKFDLPMEHPDGFHDPETP